jgi:hypothetical protein
MKRIFYIALISMVSISWIFGTSPTFAQTEENEREVDAPTVVHSNNQTTPKEFAVNDTLMEELDRLVRALEEAEHKDDQELTEALQEKIGVIKEEISQATEKPMIEIGEPRIIKQPGSPDLVWETEVVVVEPPTVVPREDTVTEVTSSRVDPCAEAKALEEKKQYYEALYALSDEELKDKGYSRGREELRITIENLERSIERYRTECETGVSSSAGGGGSGPIPPTETVPVEVVTTRPIAVGSGGEITDYYKRRIAEIAIEEVEIEKQIASLKELRNEIDKLIEELIKSKSEISTEEVSGLVETIEVRPGEVKMDKVVVKTVDKSIVARLDNKELAIKPTEAQVIIHDENLEIKAPELSIENEVLKVGASEVKLSPGAVVEEIKIEPVEMELKEENATAVYKIKTDESRKLLGFIPIKVKKILTVDAANTEVEIIEEKSPWWAFLTTK